MILLPQQPQLHGLLVLNKPSGVTSARCVSFVKRLGQKKIGHAGTLDPMAGGVLLLLLGQATKLFDYLRLDGEKTYSGTFLLGQETDTWDKEGALVAENSWAHVAEETIERSVADWVGTSEQLVPPYSAAKHEGKPLHRLARAGKETPVKTKTVEISQAAVTRMDLPSVSFRVTCGSGTYIRSLAHSLGKRLGCGAMLTELTREYSHPFGLDQAHSLDEVLDEPERLPERVIPIAACLGWPGISLDEAQEKLVRNGMPLPWASCQPEGCQPDNCQAENTPYKDGLRALFNSADGTPLALAESRIVKGEPVWAILRGLWTM